jgi:predicted transcriptional regulator
MADGGLKIEIDSALAERVRAAAEAIGVTPDVFVSELIARELLDYGSFDWDADLDPAIDRQIAEDAVRTGDLVPAEEVVRWMRSWFTVDELPTPEPRRGA